MRVPLQCAVWHTLDIKRAPASASAGASERGHTLGAHRTTRATLRVGRHRRTQLATRTSELLLEEAAPVRRLALHEPSGALWVATTATAARRWRVPPPPPALGAAPAPGAAPAGARAPAGGAGGAGGRMFVVGALPLVRARQSFDGGAARRPLAPAPRPARLQPRVSCRPRPARCVAHGLASVSASLWGQTRAHRCSNMFTRVWADRYSMSSCKPRGRQELAHKCTAPPCPAGAPKPAATEAASTAATAGLPAYVRCAVLADQRHVLAADEAGALELWDLTSGGIAECFEEVPPHLPCGYGRMFGVLFLCQ